MWNLIKRIFTNPPPPKWRLSPEDKGTYRLEKWHPNVSMYLTENVRLKNQEEANEIIKNLERPRVYLEE